MTASALSPWSAQVDLEITRRLELYREAARSRRLQALLLEECRYDPVFFVRNFVWGFDTREAPYLIPFVPFGDQEEVIRYLAGDANAGHEYVTSEGHAHSIAIEKSRDMGASFLMCAVSVWEFLFEPASIVGVMTRKGKDLDNGEINSIFGKIEHILNHLPQWMRPNWQKRKIDRVITNLDNGNVIEGEKAIEDAFRGPRYSKIRVDEAAFIRMMPKIIAGLQGSTPSVQLASTVCGMGNVFAQITHGEAGYQSTREHTAELDFEGFWRVLRLHYEQDPRRDAAWRERKMRSMTAEQWAQEYEIDYRVSLPGRMYPEYSRDLIWPDRFWRHFKAKFLPRSRIIEAWDFGSGLSLTSVVWAAHYKVKYPEPYEILVIFDYMSWQEKRFDEIARDVGAKGYACRHNLSGLQPDLRIGDVAGKARDSGQRSWIRNLRDEGISIEGRSLYSPELAERVYSKARIMLQSQKIVFAPQCDRRVSQDVNIPTLTQCMANYRRDLPDGATLATHVERASPKPRKDKYSHTADCFNYIVYELFCEDELRTVQQD